MPFISDETLALAKKYAQSGDASTLAQAKQYTDGALVTAKSYADTGDAATLADAKDYTDDAIETIPSGYTFKGTVNTVADLPTAAAGNAGWMYIVKANTHEYVSDGTEWIDKGAPLAQKANAVGTYPMLLSGQSETLMADTAEDCEFTFRAVSGTGASKTEKVSGNSMVWNQLFSASGDSVAIPEGHKYISKLGTTWAYGTGASGGTTVTSTSATDMLIDLTKMGAYWATKYTTVNAFKADYSKDYYEYCAGRVVNNNTTGLISGADSWKIVQKKIADGQGATAYPVGTQFTTHHSVYGDIVWDVVGHDQVDSATGKTHTMTLLAHNCINNVQFDAEEAFYCADAAALPAGTYNFTVTSQPWYAGDVGKTFQFTTTVALPIKGQLYIAMTYSASLAGKSVKLYSSASSTTPLETVTLTEGSGGTSLGATDVALNHIQRMAFGSNNYKESAIRQFLNSSSPAGSVWTPQTKFDRPPNWMANFAGFKAGLPSDFLDAVDFAQVKCSTNNVYESPDSTATKGGIYTVNDEFWLASRFEIYGSSDIVDGSKLMTYFVGAQNVDRIKLLFGAARYWWTRTPSSGYAYSVRSVFTDGSLNYDYAYRSGGCVPACIIGGKAGDDYGTHTLSLPITSLTGTPSGGSTAEVMFADGMCRNGNVEDEMYPANGRAVKRYLKVDMGSLNWVYEPSSGIRFYTQQLAQLVKHPVNNSTPFDGICSKYECSYWNKLNESGSDKFIAILSNNGQVAIRDTAYTDAAAFKAAMSGVYLYYEAATPTEYTFPPVCDLLSVEDGGTLEQLTPTGTEPTSAPFKGEMRFPVNIFDELDNKVDKAQGVANAGKFMKVGADGNILPVAEARYELIEEITLTEAIGGIIRTQTPSSYSGGVKGYNFKKVFMRLVIPAGITGLDVYFSCHNTVAGVGNAQGRGAFGNAVYQAIPFFSASIVGGLLTGYNSGNIYGSNNNNIALQSTGHVYEFAQDNIARCEVGCALPSATFPVGTVLKIYGIWA